MRNAANGFTLIEIIIVTAIMLLLGGIAVLSWSSMQDSAALRAARDAIVFHLEESKSRAVSGTGGEAQGLYFAEDTYVQFEGETYDDDDDTNVVYDIDPDIVLSIEGSGTDTIVFSRITGFTGNTATVTVALRSNASTTRAVVVGAGGDISIVE